MNTFEKLQIGINLLQSAAILLIAWAVIRKINGVK